jgi:hypothetical protein
MLLKRSPAIKVNIATASKTTTAYSKSLQAWRENFETSMCPAMELNVEPNSIEVKKTVNNAEYTSTCRVKSLTGNHHGCCIAILP